MPSVACTPAVLGLDGSEKEMGVSALMRSESLKGFCWHSKMFSNSGKLLLKAAMKVSREWAAPRRRSSGSLSIASLLVMLPATSPGTTQTYMNVKQKQN